jgi:serine/threonine-protein kinase
MEYVDGEVLTTFAERGGLTTLDRTGLFEGICAAVQYAHQRLVVHRDLKPANILVTVDRNPKLLDFGIAKLLEVGDDEAPQTRTGLRLMTPEYASPEQVLGEPVTTGTDVYALGVVLYELLTGRRPYEVGGRRLAEIEAVICRTEPPRPSDVAAPGVADELRGDLDTIVL